MKFEIIGYADVSTAYLEEQDLDLLETAPHHLAEVDDGAGTILYVPLDDEDLKRFEQKSREHGLSDRFRQIIEELYRQQVCYVRFDRDGGEIEGLDHAEVFAEAV